MICNLIIILSLILPPAKKKEKLKNYSWHKYLYSKIEQSFKQYSYKKPKHLYNLSATPIFI